MANELVREQCNPLAETMLAFIDARNARKEWLYTFERMKGIVIDYDKTLAAYDAELEKCRAAYMVEWRKWIDLLTSPETKQCETPSTSSTT